MNTPAFRGDYHFSLYLKASFTDDKMIFFAMNFKIGSCSPIGLVRDKEVMVWPCPSA